MEVINDEIQRTKLCPINFALEEFDKKWTINIIKSIYLGSKRFNEILGHFPDLSNKVLSDRLKELGEKNIIKKEVKSTTPLLIEYSLTKKGLSLNKILFELSMYTVKNHPDKLNIKSIEEEKKILLKKIYIKRDLKEYQKQN